MKQGLLLIVDDNSGIRILLKELFSAEGYTVITAESGLEAIASAQKQPPNLVLADIKMPGINGLELRNKLLDLDQNIRIILMSAYTDQYEIREIVRERKIDYLITKPFDLEQLRMLVATLVNEKNTLGEITKARIQPQMPTSHNQTSHE